MDTIISHDPLTLSPLALFAAADPIVKTVLVLLLVASVWTWSIIIGKSTTLRRLSKASEKFEAEFARIGDVDAFAREQQSPNALSAKVFQAGFAEWKASLKGKPVDREGVRARLATAMQSSVASSVERLEDTLNILATIGSVAPFVGLFGTVWGIMRSFTGIAAAQNTSLSVVAPGIAEALFATALGLFAAIPAVIAFNRFSHGIARIEAKLMRFADLFHLTLSRELDQL